MKRTLKLIAPPTGIQPGGYIPRAYDDRLQARTPEASLEVWQTQGRWVITLGWPLSEPSGEGPRTPAEFADAAALFCPEHPDSAWATMGAPGRPVSGVFWRAGADKLLVVRAEGLGTVERHAAPEDWRGGSEYRTGWHQLRLELNWPLLERRRCLAFAIWRGGDQERAGLKSVTPGWVTLP